ncbi:MAG: DUF2894 domain-containing protein [Halioglobus sp.]
MKHQQRRPLTKPSSRNGPRPKGSKSISQSNNTDGEQHAPELLTAVNSLRENGAHRFDPVRFRFIESMATQAAQQSRPVEKLINDKTLDAIYSYTEDLAVAREHAATLITANAKENPDKALLLQQLFDQCRYREIGRITARRGLPDKVALLQGLTAALAQEKANVQSEDAELPFSELIARQEKEALGHLDASSASSTHSASTSGFELKSTKRFRDSRAKARADQVVKRAIEECPEDAGPLNPQRLTIDSLAAMRELSPHYLNRFVEHIDTLLWLETLAKETKSVAPKRTGGTPKKSKRAKPEP